MPDMHISAFVLALIQLYCPQLRVHLVNLTIMPRLHSLYTL